MKLSPYNSDIILPLALNSPVLLNFPIPPELGGVISPLNIILFPALTVGVAVSAARDTQVSPLSNE